MKFKTKGELLEYLGKDKKDTKLVDRMMVRGEVVRVEGEYEYNNPVLEKEKKLKDKIEGLEWLLDLKETQVENLNREIKELKNNPANITPANTSNTASNEDAVNWEYYMNKNEEKKAIIEKILNDIYIDARKRGSMENEDEFLQRMYEKYGFSPRED